MIKYRKGAKLFTLQQVQVEVWSKSKRQYIWQTKMTLLNNMGQWVYPGVYWRTNAHKQADKFLTSEGWTKHHDTEMRVSF